MLVSGSVEHVFQPTIIYWQESCPKFPRTITVLILLLVPCSATSEVLLPVNYCWLLEILSVELFSISRPGFQPSLMARIISNSPLTITILMIMLLVVLIATSEVLLPLNCCWLLEILPVELFSISRPRFRPSLMARIISNSPLRTTVLILLL